MSPEQIQQLIASRAKLDLKKVLKLEPGAIDGLMFWVAKRISRFGAWLIEGPDGSPYLLRIYLTPKRHAGAWWPGIFLHRFFRSDHDRFPHNHPWGSSVSLVLTNGYTEERWNKTLKRSEFFRKGPFRINVIRANDFHRVELHSEEHGAWTLFVAFKRAQDWGFLDTDHDKFIPWKEFLAEGANGLEND